MNRRVGLVAVLACGAAACANADERQSGSIDLSAAALNSVTVAGEEPASEPSPALTVDGKPWKFVIAPYLWIPAQHGTIGIRRVNANVSMTVGDTWNALWDNFRFAGCLHMEAVKDRWSIFGDAMYMHLGNDVKDLPVNVNYKQGIFELGCAYAIHDGPLPGAAADSTVRVRIEPLVGVRVWYLDATIETPIDSRGVNETWVDGFGGIRGELAFNETFSLTGRVDIGTGMSDLTWNALTMVNVNLNEHWALFAGWRWLSDNYSKGSDMDRFAYDMMFNGPFAGVKITF